jgi:hypothetical protein
MDPHRCYQLKQAYIADLHHQAERDALARAARMPAADACPAGAACPRRPPPARHATRPPHLSSRDARPGHQGAPSAIPPPDHRLTTGLSPEHK